MPVTRLDQHMAATAAAMLPATINRDLRTRYRQLPVLLHTCGLIAAYAFLVSKAGGDDATATAYARVVEGVRAHLADRGLAVAATPLDLLRVLSELPHDRYALAAADARALAGWLSRLAEATFQAQPKSTGEGPS
jgi:CRISPR/Cas system CMR-associated protein Cmr5 small subunit